MIFIGTDIVSILRIKRLIIERGNRFLDHVYTKHEQKICNNKAAPWIHYSGKFAAKEAVKKAILSSNSINNISLKSIEIDNDPMGAPIIKLNKRNIKQHKLKVSLSHAGEYATATVILEIK